MRLLVAHNDTELVEDLKYNFAADGDVLQVAATISRAIELLKSQEFDIVLMDMDFPDGTGLDLRRKISDYKDIPTIVISKRDEVKQKVLALEYGCDDYMVSPIDLFELKARIRAVLRRRQGAKDKAMEIQPNFFLFEKAGFTFHLIYRTVEYKKQPLDLTIKEFDILVILILNMGRVLSREQLSELVWSNQVPSNDRTVDVHIRRLREKLEKVDAAHFIQTKWGEGYQFRGDLNL